MFDKYDHPNLVDITPKDAYRAVLFQMIFWRRQTEKLALAKMLRDASIGKENDAYESYTEYLDIVFSGTASATKGGLDTAKVKEIMEEESKKAYIVSPISGLNLKKKR